MRVETESLLLSDEGEGEATTRFCIPTLATFFPAMISYASSPPSLSDSDSLVTKNIPFITITHHLIFCIYLFHNLGFNEVKKIERREERKEGGCIYD